jgi:hypothetical protein
MWGFIANLATSFLGWYASSPMARQIVNQVVADLKNEGARVLPVAIAAIKEVATDNGRTAHGKFSYVANAVAVEIPTAQANMTNSMIDLAYRVLKNDPSVPEVQ